MYSGILTAGDDNSDVPVRTDRLQTLSKLLCLIFFSVLISLLYQIRTYFSKCTKTRHKYVHWLPWCLQFVHWEKSHKTYIFLISSSLNKDEGKPIFSTTPYLITQLPNSTIPLHASHWSAEWKRKCLAQTLFV